jgi:hypothetical protein
MFNINEQFFHIKRGKRRFTEQGEAKLTQTTGGNLESRQKKSSLVQI